MLGYGASVELLASCVVLLRDCTVVVGFDMSALIRGTPDILLRTSHRHRDRIHINCTQHSAPIVDMDDCINPQQGNDMQTCNEAMLSLNFSLPRVHRQVSTWRAPWPAPWHAPWHISPRGATPLLQPVCNCDICPSFHCWSFAFGSSPILAYRSTGLLCHCLSKMPPYAQCATCGESKTPATTMASLCQCVLQVGPPQHHFQMMTSPPSYCLKYLHPRW